MEKQEEKTKEKTRNNSSYILPASIILAALIVSAAVLMSCASQQNADTTGLAVVPSNEENTAAQTQAQAQNNENTESAYNTDSVGKTGTFTETNNEICMEDGKPVVYLFSTTWCPHCEWIKDTFDETVKRFVSEGKIVAYHWEVDLSDNTLTEEVETSVPEEHMAVYRGFNPNGTIPTFVFGCKYYRIGTGYEREDDLAAEQQDFEQLINALSG